MINADWVQLNCRCKPIQVQFCKLEFNKSGQVLKDYESGFDHRTVFTSTVETIQPNWHRDYKVIKQPFTTSLANEIYYVYYRNARIAEVLTACNELVDEHTVFVRFDNKFLYGIKLYDRVQKFLADNDLIFYNWTRLDVCNDFNYFLDALGKKSFVPSDLIKRYASGNIRLCGKRFVGIFGNNDDGGFDCQTLNLGRATSNVQATLYNKTKEMANKEDKPHIREQWELNSDIDTTADVWRLEFKLKKFDTLVIANDEVKLSLQTLEILKDENLELLWNVLREKQFTFYYQDWRKNSSRKKRVKLFNYEKTGCKLEHMPQTENTKRAHKIFIKKLLETQQVIRQFNDMNNISWATDYLAAHLVKRHDLIDWVKSRFPTWKVDDYIDRPAVEIKVYSTGLFDPITESYKKHAFSY